jgi:hypothetical protein
VRGRGISDIRRRPAISDLEARRKKEFTAEGTEAAELAENPEESTEFGKTNLRRK